MITHLGDKVAHVTAADRSKWDGKAAATHTHGASDINSGTLGVARGGTGKTSWLANRLFYATTAAAIGQMPFPTADGMYLCQNKSGAPFWRTVEQPKTSEAGTYVGTGKTGSSAKNSIVFQAGTPKVVLIAQKDYTRYGILILAPNAATGFSVIEGGVLSSLKVDVSGNTVSWYYNSTDSHPANQLDHAGQTYAYVGVF